jgi:hypothetical protein
MTARFLIVEIVHRNAPQKSGNQPIRSGLGKAASTPRLRLSVHFTAFMLPLAAAVRLSPRR